MALEALLALLPTLREVGLDGTLIDNSYEMPRDMIPGIIKPQLVSNSGQTLTPLLEMFEDDDRA